MTTVIEGLALLREQFPDAAIGKLPKVTCPACSKKECREHTKKKCATCGAFISPSHIHIDYVGHAEVTDRLLTVDPSWTWEPVAFGQDGLPALVRNERQVPVGMWIRLTVLGVTRLGYGSCEPKPEAVKELIGDAIRNAAMRFGVALDLWSKNDLESLIAEVGVDQDGGEAASVARPAASRGRTAVSRAKAAVASARPTEPPLPGEEPEPPAPAAVNGNGHGQRSGAAGSASAVTTTAADVDPDKMTAAQNRMIHALFNGLGITDENAQRAAIAAVLGHPVDSRGSLSKVEATAVIDSLKQGAPKPADLEEANR